MTFMAGLLRASRHPKFRPWCFGLVRQGWDKGASCRNTTMITSFLKTAYCFEISSAKHFVEIIKIENFQRITEIGKSSGWKAQGFHIMFLQTVTCMRKSTKNVWISMPFWLMSFRRSRVPIFWGSQLKQNTSWINKPPEATVKTTCRVCHMFNFSDLLFKKACPLT